MSNNAWIRAYSDIHNYSYINSADVHQFYIGRDGPDLHWIIWADHNISGSVGLLGAWATEDEAAGALAALLRAVDLSTADDQL